MVSSKFSRSKHNFRIPDVCKKKLEAEEAPPADIPYPPPFLDYHYNVDITFYIWHYVFSGLLHIPFKYTIGAATYWESPLPKPTNGEWGKFDHSSTTGVWHAYIEHLVGGLVKINARNTGNIPNSPPNFGPGIFEIGFPAYYTGVKEGNIVPAE